MKTLFLIFALLLAPLAAQADDAARDRIVQSLRNEGYSEIRIFRTFLGRLRFVAENGETRREIVLNPATGVILRDYLRALEDDEDRDEASGSTSEQNEDGSGNEPDDEDRGDDDGGDDDDDGNEDSDDDDD